MHLWKTLCQISQWTIDANGLQTTYWRHTLDLFLILVLILASDVSSIRGVLQTRVNHFTRISKKRFRRLIQTFFCCAVNGLHENQNDVYVKIRFMAVPRVNKQT